MLQLRQALRHAFDRHEAKHESQEKWRQGDFFEQSSLKFHSLNRTDDYGTTNNWKLPIFFRNYGRGAAKTV
jgi:hypothetical protein